MLCATHTTHGQLCVMLWIQLVWMGCFGQGIPMAYVTHAHMV